MKKRLFVLSLLLVGVFSISIKDIKYTNVVDNKMFLEPGEEESIDIAPVEEIINEGENLEIAEPPTDDLPVDNNIYSIGLSGTYLDYYSNVYEYEIELYDHVDKIDFSIIVNDKSLSYEVVGNENLHNGSIINIMTEPRDMYKQAVYSITVHMPDVVTSKNTINWKLVISLFIILLVLLVIIVVSKLRIKKEPIDNKDDLLQKGSLSTHGVQPITDINRNNNNINIGGQPQTIVQPQPVSGNSQPVNATPLANPQPQQVVVNSQQVNGNPQQVVVTPVPNNQTVQTVVIPQSNTPQQVVDSSDIELPAKKDEN